MYLCLVCPRCRFHISAWQSHAKRKKCHGDSLLHDREPFWSTGKEVSCVPFLVGHSGPISGVCDRGATGFRVGFFFGSRRRDGSLLTALQIILITYASKFTIHTVSEWSCKNMSQLNS